MRTYTRTHAHARAHTQKLTHKNSHTDNDDDGKDAHVMQVTRLPALTREDKHAITRMETMLICTPKEGEYQWGSSPLVQFYFDADSVHWLDSCGAYVTSSLACQQQRSLEH